MTPLERMNAIAELLGIEDRLNRDSGGLAREHMLTNILHELAQRSMKPPVLTLPKGKK
jgi:hypothetical protein